MLQPYELEQLEYLIREAAVNSVIFDDAMALKVQSIRQHEADIAKSHTACEISMMSRMIAQDESITETEKDRLLSQLSAGMPK